MKLWSPNRQHTFAGDHALGGTRHTLAGMRRWYQRLFGLFPGVAFEVKDIVVSGWPWATTLAIEVVDRATLKGGYRYVNEGVFLIRMRWGRLVRMQIHLDTSKTEAALHHLAQVGLTEAAAPPIEDWRVRMKYQEYSPHRSLQDYVKCCWMLERDYTPEDPDEEVIPDACIELIFSWPFRRERRTVRS